MALGRFIPTRVGSISSPFTPEGFATVHPHSRGEHIEASGDAPAEAGSSPLAWGAFQPECVWLNPARFIPTRVGSMMSAIDCAAVYAVHPHSRGEHGMGGLGDGGFGGSSPLAWGALPPGCALPRHCWFIPTRVGSICRTVACFDYLPVHPHSRGEHPGNVRPKNLRSGSSPLAWGASQPHAPVSRPSRFIPTRVGSISDVIIPSSPQPVHPHSRGEHQAGARVSWRAPVHPHSRGEHVVRGSGSVAAHGSSPLAWGAFRCR